MHEWDVRQIEEQQWRCAICARRPALSVICCRVGACDSSVCLSTDVPQRGRLCDQMLYGSVCGERLYCAVVRLSLVVRSFAFNGL